MNLLFLFVSFPEHSIPQNHRLINLFACALKLKITASFFKRQISTKRYN